MNKLVRKNNQCVRCGAIQEGSLRFAIAATTTPDWCLVGGIGLLCPECYKCYKSQTE